MNLAAVEREIYERLNGDATLAAALTGDTDTSQEIFNGLATEAARLPYVVFNVTGAQHEDTFDTDNVTLSIAVTVYGERPSHHDECSTALDRIYGDAVDQGDRVPTYGLHRWTFSTITDDTSWSGTEVRRLSMQTAHTDEAYVYTDTYEVDLQRG